MCVFVCTHPPLPLPTYLFAYFLRYMPTPKILNSTSKLSVAVVAPQGNGLNDAKNVDDTVSAEELELWKIKAIPKE